MYRAGIKRRFSAAHSLTGHPGECSRLHGHTWTVEAVFAAVEIPGSGMVVDFSDAARALESVIEPFDHTYLNEVEPFGELLPTAENVAKTIFARLEGMIASESWQVRLESVTVWESPEAWASYSS